MKRLIHWIAGQAAIFCLWILISGTPALAAPTLTTTPANGGTLNFGSVDVGDSSAMDVMVTNSGTGTVNGISAGLTTGTVFTITGNNCTSLSAGANCTVQITFSPVASGMVSDTLTIDSTNDGSSSITVQGTGVDTVIAQIDPTTWDYGMVAVNSSSTSQIFTVTSLGNLDLDIGTVLLAGSDPGQFTIDSDACSNATLMTNETCEIAVSCTPDSVGTFSATLEVPSNDPNTPTAATLDCEGTNVPAVSADPDPLDFGIVFVSQVPKTESITVTNSGAADLTVTSVALATGTDFSITMEDCTSSSPIAPSGTCTIEVQLTNSGVGNYMDGVEITSDAPTSVDTVDVAAEVQADAPAVSLSPTDVNFGNQAEGTTSSIITVTLTNVGTGDLNVSAVGLSGVDGTNFNVEAEDCTTAPVSPAGTCTIDLTFSPDAVVTFAASLDITSDAASSPDSVPLSGTGISAAAPVLILSPSSLAFGDLPIQGTANLTVMVQNGGISDLVVGTITLGGADPVQFTVTADTCSGAVLVEQATCSIEVQFSPEQLGNFLAALNIPSNASSTPDTVVLSGTGIGIPSFSGGGCSFHAQDQVSAWASGYGVLFLLMAFLALRIRRE